MKHSDVKFEVWSEYVTEDRETPPTHTREVTRTERGMAEQDVSILQTMLHRKAWIREVPR